MVPELQHAESTWMASDLMAFSGFIAVIVGIGWSILIDRNQAALLSRWHDAAIIDLSTNMRQKIERDLQRRSLFWQCIIVSVVVVSMIIGYASFYDNFDLLGEFLIASFVSALLVSQRLARLVGHGLIGRIVKDRMVPFGMTIEHPDRTGGTAQIGIFYLLQASVLTIPVLWLLVWIILIPSMQDYARWADHFFTLLIIAIVVFCLAFALPMLAFRRIIRDWKRANISNSINSIRDELLNLRTIESPTLAQRRRRAELARHLDSLIHLPNWPVSLATRNVFVSTFMVPLLVNVVTIAVRQ